MKSLCWLALCASLLVPGVARAQSLNLNPADIRGQSSKEPVSVLQNRYFLKAWRPEVGLTVGFLLDEAYTNTVTYGVRAGMYFNEWFGFSVEQDNTKVSDSTDRKALNTLQYHPINGSQTEVVSPDPEVNAIHQITDFTGEAAPFYGKLNVFNKWIIYTDLYMTGGVSRLDTDQGTKTGPTVGAGERFYIGQSWSVRINFKDRIFSEDRGGSTSTRNSKAVDFGASYFFN